MWGSQNGTEPVRSKLERICSSADFRRVREKGRCWSDPRMVLCTYRNGLPVSRFGYSVSKRIGKAVTRNRVKRLMRESVWSYYDLVVPGWDVVIIARQKIGTADYWDVQRSVGHLLGMANIFHAEEQAVAE